MIRAEVMAFPMLLFASYVIYRIGVNNHQHRIVDAVRISVQGILLGVLSGVSIQFVERGLLRMPWGMAVPILTVIGLLGLVAMDVAAVMWTMRPIDSSQQSESS